ncbi:hypothetical protein RFI_29010 [Reticulomyxa filosa]|uniref:Uncharacterized protein n=1 Tax=Reticulomyxa filosa TaxID=46433 RepID=X6M4K5_RETFI|nr:hypothetical protein RFI_29010 [Reticulomyxa filosa]|eukprot:ETO08377.1 hypothetical protein RFI_29010 [Reticulomyxa filosa]
MYIFLFVCFSTSKKFEVTGKNKIEVDIVFLITGINIFFSLKNYKYTLFKSTKCYVSLNGGFVEKGVKLLMEWGKKWKKKKKWNNKKEKKIVEEKNILIKKNGIINKKKKEKKRKKEK